MFPVTQPWRWLPHLKVWWANREERKRNFLSQVSGVIHIGANTGQERHAYAAHDVIWIEPIPDVFDKLLENIQDFPKQGRASVSHRPYESSCQF